jgi:hypothetical protein
MSVLFSLDAQRCGQERHARAEADGLGIVVDLDGHLTRVRTPNEALHVARDYIGEYLQPAQRAGVPWGLMVTVTDGVAVYGEWPLAGSNAHNPTFQRTPLVRIRNRWHDSGPLSALANAVEIIRAYLPSGQRRRAA